MGLPGPSGTVAGFAGAGMFRNCTSPASAVTIRRMASATCAWRIWSALRAGLPIPTGPIHSAASR